MTSKDDINHQASALRRQAEEIALEKPALSLEDIQAMSVEEIQQMFHKQRMQQIELKLQNEELRTAQAQIEVGRARFLDLYESAPVGYCTLSEQGLIVEANLTAATLLGVVHGSLVKQPISRFILKEDQDIYHLHHKKLFETGDPQKCELRLVKFDNTFFWAYLTATVVQGEDGSPACRVAIIDIINPKQAEEALLENEQFLQILLESLPIPVFYKDAEGRYKGFNKAFETFFGKSRVELIGTSVFDINPPELAKIYHLNDLELYEKVSKKIYESQVRNAYGELRNVVFHKATLTNTSGAISGIVGAIMDITENKRAEEAIIQSNNLLQTII